MCFSNSPEQFPFPSPFFSLSEVHLSQPPATVPSQLSVPKSTRVAALSVALLVFSDGKEYLHCCFLSNRQHRTSTNSLESQKA